MLIIIMGRAWRLNFKKKEVTKRIHTRYFTARSANKKIKDNW